MTPMWWHWTMRAVGIILLAGGAVALYRAQPLGIRAWVRERLDNRWELRHPHALWDVAELRAIGADMLATRTERSVAMSTEINQDALEVARKKVEDVLIEFRDSRIFILGGNGFVAREKDGSESSIMRLSTADGLRIGIKAYLEALESEPTP